MDENNNFLESYKKKNTVANGESSSAGKEDTNLPAQGGEKAPPPVRNNPTEKPAVKQEASGLKFEQKNEFVKPVKKEFAPLPPPPKRPKWLLPAVIGGAVLIIAVVVLIILLSSGIPVEDFTGWTESNAQLWANEKGVALQIEKEFNDKYEETKVISQSVPAGKKVRKGDFIKLTVSKGHDLTVKLKLPDLMSMNQQEVEKWAAENFMAKVRITAEYSDTVPLGSVIRFEINDNTVVDEVTRNTPIYVIVCKGSEDAAAIAVTVPNFKEKTLAESYVWANENGVTLKVEELFDDYVPEGSVISQSVKADEKVKKGDEIKITVSKGKMITVPSFAGYSKEEAAAVASGLGITVVVVEKYAGASAGRFVSQSVAEGAEYEKGMAVELKYSLGSTIWLASYVSQTQDAIETWAKGLNDNGAVIKIKPTYVKSSVAKGTILAQSPVNENISYKKYIYITVSSGKQQYMPNFVASEGMGYDVAYTRGEVIAACNKLNIVPVFEQVNASNRLPGEVWYQDHKAGTEVAEGTKVVFKYNITKNIIVPNFVGEMKNDIISEYNRTFTLVFVDYGTYDALKIGRIAEQSIAKNATVSYGSTITLKVYPDSP
jgi:serine/threonine-protein kinase